MHEENIFCYDPVLSMARCESPMNLPLLDDSFSLPIQSDPDPILQEVAVTTTDNTTMPTTPPSHFENDLANLSLPSTSVKINKTNSCLYNCFKTNDTPFLCLINKGEVQAKIEQFSYNPVPPPATITQPLELLQESASSFSPKNNDKESQSELACTMSLKDINDLLLDPNSKPNPKSDGNIKQPQYDAPVPSTSGSFVTPQKTDCSKAPTKNAIAARENRVKKKVYVEGLEKSVEDLQKENRDLVQKLESVTSKYEKRGSEIEYLKSVLLNEGKLSNILKNVPYINSVGFPLKSAEKGPCVGGMSPVKTEARGTSCCCQCISHNNKNKNISENPLASSSSSSTTSLPCSLQLRNINIMKDSPVGGVPEKDPQKKDPFLRGSGSSYNCQVENIKQLQPQPGMNKDLRKTLSGRVSKNEKQKCFSTWGTKDIRDGLHQGCVIRSTLKAREANTGVCVCGAAAAVVFLVFINQGLASMTRI